MSSSPRVLLIDIETSPNLGYSWTKYDTTIIKQVRSWELLSFAYKELGRSPTHCLARPDFDDTTEKALVSAVWEVLDGADVIIAHNGDAFDVKKLRAKFVKYSLPPPSPFKTIDTRKIARACFGFYSNSLNDIASDLGLGEKVDTGGFKLWEGCMAGDPKAWAKMIRYNKHDVVLLEKVYLRLKAWYPSHPNFALYNNRPGCPVCASTNVQSRGVQVLKARTVPRYHCQACGHWYQGKVSRCA